jgi:hypothetical protein
LSEILSLFTIVNKILSDTTQMQNTVDELTILT